MKQPKHFISVGYFEDADDGELFLKDFEAPVDEGEELDLFLLNTFAEFLGVVGSVEIYTTDSGSGEDGKVEGCFVLDDTGEVE